MAIGRSGSMLAEERDAPITSTPGERGAREGIAGKRILVVDDEESVRDLMGGLLKRMGHRIKLAENAAEALDEIETDEFDLVLTDLRMPGMTGDELALEIHKRRPRLVVGLVTGTVPMRPPPGVAFVLGKPFSIGELRDAVAAR